MRGIRRRRFTSPQRVYRSSRPAAHSSRPSRTASPARGQVSSEDRGGAAKAAPRASRGQSRLGAVVQDLQAGAAVTVANFADRLAEAVERKRSQLVVGLDPVVEQLPV